ncbi:MAG: hypothetical protein MUF83_01635 [Acidimicrobiales bacterium]|nr:hypothetical protein [Acidimicrobiales bacterium]
MLASNLDRPAATTALTRWGTRRWATAGAAAIGTALLIGLPTDVIPNPVFGRPVPVTWWALPVLLVTSALGGLLLATYVREPGTELDRPARAAGIGGLLGYFAVGCPVCNKLVVLALGTTGALELFAPVQPLLAVGSVVLLAVALRARLRGEIACPVDTAALG